MHGGFGGGQGNDPTPDERDAEGFWSQEGSETEDESDPEQSWGQSSYAGNIQRDQPLTTAAALGNQYAGPAPYQSALDNWYAAVQQDTEQQDTEQQGTEQHTTGAANVDEYEMGEYEYTPDDNPDQRQPAATGHGQVDDPAEADDDNTGYGQDRDADTGGNVSEYDENLDGNEGNQPLGIYSDEPPDTDSHDTGDEAD